MLDALNPLSVVLLAWCSAPALVVQSTVSGSEHVGHVTFSEDAEKPIKQALQNTCPQEVTFNKILNKQVSRVKRKAAVYKDILTKPKSRGTKKRQ